MRSVCVAGKAQCNNSPLFTRDSQKLLFCFFTGERLCDLRELRTSEYTHAPLHSLAPELLVQSLGFTFCLQNSTPKFLLVLFQHDSSKFRPHDTSSTHDPIFRDTILVLSPRVLEACVPITSAGWFGAVESDATV